MNIKAAESGGDFSVGVPPTHPHLFKREVEQPLPIPNHLPHIADLVLADMVERKQLGIQRYGTPLQAHNGRDALLDAYQEALDLALYLRQAIYERDEK